MLGGCHPEVGTDPAAIESVPVTDLDREPEPGQRRDAPQTSEPVNHGRELTVSGHSCDRGVKTVPAVDHRGHRVIGGIERVLQPRLVETLPAQPLVMGHGPRLATGVDDSLTQQQLAEPVPGAHQITTGVLTGPHQISCRLLSHRRNRHLHNLAELEQPGQVQRVLGVGLHSVPDRSLQLRRRRDQRLHSGSVQMPGQPESRRTCLIRRPPRTRQALDPRLDLPVIRDQTLPEHLTSDTIDRRSHDGSCVHIQTNTRTLTHTGASHNCRIGRAGSPRSVTHESCERGPGPTTPQQSRAVTTYRLGERRADLFLVRAWPGQPKGHERHLVEVKVSRADLRAELAAPEKMAVFAAFAHRVYFATPAGLVKDTDELGPGVGLIEVHPFGTTREVRRATRRPNPEPMPEKLVVEVFRRAGRAEARTRTATAGEDPAARVVALEAELATARRAQYTAQDAARRDAGRLTEWLRKVSDAGGVPCKCGGTIKPRRDTYQLGRPPRRDTYQLGGHRD